MKPYRRLGDSRKSVWAPRRSSTAAERGGAGNGTRTITHSRQRGTGAKVTTEEQRLRTVGHIDRGIHRHRRCRDARGFISDNFAI